MEITPCSTPKEYSFFKLVEELCPENSFRAPFQRLCALMRHFNVQTLTCETLKDEATLEASLRSWGKQGRRISREIKAVRTRCENDCAIEVERLTFFSAQLQDKKTFLEQEANAPSSLLAQAVAIRVYFKRVPQVRWIAYIKECVVADRCAMRQELENVTPKGGTLQNPIFLNVRRKFKLHVGGKEFAVWGTFFCQQNTVTNVCAHACVEMMLNNIPSLGAREDWGEDDLVCAEDINSLLKINHGQNVIKCDQLDSGNAPAKRRVWRGLREAEITAVLHHYGLKPVIIPLDESRLIPPKYRQFLSPVEFRDALYPFVESGNPAMLIFETRPSKEVSGSVSKSEAEERERHVVAVFGHELDVHSWIPSAVAWYTRDNSGNSPNALSSQLWADSLLIADDAIGMLATLPAHTFSVSLFQKTALRLHPHSVICVMQPHNSTSLLPPTAERIARNAIEYVLLAKPPPVQINKKNLYIRRLRDLLRRKRTDMLVTRTCAITAEEYCDHLKAETDAHGCAMSKRALQKVRAQLSKHGKKYWMVEFSEPPLFTTNTSKVGEVLVKMPQRKVHYLEDLVKLIRVPEAAFVSKSGRFTPIGGKFFESHIKLFSRSLALLQSKDQPSGDV